MGEANSMQEQMDIGSRERNAKKKKTNVRDQK